MELVTGRRLAADLRSLGLGTDQVVMVHCRMSAVGWVPGGEQTINDALRTVVGADGTIVMPTQSWQLCDPAYLNDPAVPSAWWDTIRSELPAYDPASTPTRTMGAVAELFRSLPGTVRSAHPHRSVAAAGPAAAGIVAEHALADPCGERSPLSALYDLDAQVLLLGVGYTKCTALHLAECRGDPPGRHAVANGAPLLVDGRRQWVTWHEPWPSDDDFDHVGEAFAATGAERRGRVGAADTRLVGFRDLVDFAARWFPAHRDEAVFSRDGTADHGE